MSWPWAVLVLILSLAVTAGLGLGHGSLGGEWGNTFLVLRGTRVALAGLAGAALAVAGVVLQALFRNPLASPSVLGTTAGAALGGQVMVLLQGTLIPLALPPEMGLPVGCLLGAGLSLLVVLGAARRAEALGGDPGMTLLLTGILWSSACAAVASLVTWLAQDRWELGRALVAFTLGGVEGKGTVHILIGLPLVTAGIVGTWWWSRALDLLLSGDDEAASLGVPVAAARGWLLVWTAMLAAAAVAIGGGVAFVGLIVPHALRPWFGHGHRNLLPAAAVGGAAFLIATDALCRLAPGASLPLGVLTALVGAPVFALILLRRPA